MAIHPIYQSMFDVKLKSILRSTVADCPLSKLSACLAQVLVSGLNIIVFVIKFKFAKNIYGDDDTCVILLVISNSIFIELYNQRNAKPYSNRSCTTNIRNEGMTSLLQHHCLYLRH